MINKQRGLMFFSSLFLVLFVACEDDDATSNDPAGTTLQTPAEYAFSSRFSEGESSVSYSGQVVRLALLSAHYSQPLDWNDELLQSQKNTIDKWYKLYEETKDTNILDISETLLDDLNTPGFIAKIHELYNAASKGDKKSKSLFNNACKLIGLFNISKEEWENQKKTNIKVSEDYIVKKITERTKAKKDKNFTLADQIRKDLLDKGILIEDQKDKTVWKLK